MEATAEITAAVKNVPVLRFPEFEGEWKGKKGSDLFYNSRTKGNELLPIYSVTLNRGLVPRDSLERTMGNDAKATDNLYVAKNDITYNMMRMWQGAYGLAKTDCMVSPAYVVLRPRNNVCPEFFVSLFSRSRSLYLFTAFSYGLTSDRLRLYYKDFARIKFAVPKLTEQQKIASFLTIADEKIQQLIKKKELLEKYKKGVMQQIFSLKIRFKDDNDNDFPEWDEKQLRDIGEFKTSSVDKKISEGEKVVYLVNYMNVYRHETITNENKTDLMQVTAKENQVENCNLKKGDILFTPSSETPADIGHSIVISEDLENTLYSYHLMRFRPTVELDILYSHYFCNIPSVLNQLSKFATGSTRFTISVDNFSQIKILMPSLQEQAKIGRFLSSIDNKINYTSKQLEQAQQFKKGLLQQLFV